MKRETFGSRLGFILVSAGCAVGIGNVWKFPAGIKGYMSYGLPLLIIIIYLKGYYDKFQPMGTKTLIGWMIVAFLFLAFVIGCSCGKSNAEKVDK